MDTLARTIKLEALGFDRPKAEGLVQMVKQSIDEEVAKKVDLLELKAELKLDIANMKVEIGGMKAEIGEMKGEIGKLKGLIEALNEKVDKIASGLNGKIESMGRDLHFKLGRLMLGLFTLFFAALVFIEPLKRRLGVDQDSIIREEQASKEIKTTAKP